MAGTATADTSALFEFDLEACGGDGEVAGADEVGRGCLAGPIVAAAVVFDYTLMKPDAVSPLLNGLGDSKKLTSRVREQLFPLIIRHASRFTIISYSSRTIDRDGLQKTNLRVLARSLEALVDHSTKQMSASSPQPVVALVDGHLSLPDCKVPHRPVKKGDSKSACIAAASILAKVTRDRLMLKLHESYPEYGFDGHVGYGCLSHREAIVKFGYSPLHRRSFNVSLPGDHGRPESAGAPAPGTG